MNEVHFNRRIGPANLKKLFHGYYKRLMASGVNGTEVGLAICVKIRFEPVHFFQAKIILSAESLGRWLNGLTTDDASAKLMGPML